MLKSIDFWPLVPKKLSVESSINDDVHQKSMFNVPIYYTISTIIHILPMYMNTTKRKKKIIFGFLKFP